MRRGAFWGLILLVIGMLLLMDNMGLLAMLNVSAWGLIWPALLIGAGVWVLYGATRKVDPADVVTKDWSLAQEGDTALKLTLEYGAGEIFVAGGADAGNLIDGSFEGGVTSVVNRQDGLTKVKLASDWTNGPWFWGPWQGNYRRRWDMRIDERIPVELVVKSGAASCQMDLTHVKVTKLRLETGASSTDVTLPANAGYTEVRGSGGAASMNMIVPEGVAARVHTQSGIASVHVNQNRFPRQGNVYQSPDYETAVNKVDIHLEMGVGSVEVR